MRNDGIDTVIERLLDCDPAACERDDVLVALRDLHRVQGWAEAAKFACKRRLDELAADGRSESAGAALTDEAGRSGKDAKATEEREQVCSEHPELEDALVGGEISTAHLDVIARLTKRLSELERVDLNAVWADVERWARADYVTEFERKLRQLIFRIRAMNTPADEVAELDRQRNDSHMKRWTDQATGLDMTLLAMDPIRAAAFHAAVEAALATLLQDSATGEQPFGSLQIDAILAAMSTSDAGGGERRIPEVVVHVDAHSMHRGRHSDTMSETVDGVPIPPETVHRMCCEAVIAAVIVNPDGTTQRLCAETRTANREQRRALAAMYSTCAHPHCQVPFTTCRIHHVIWWSRGGKTVLANLLPLCERHHHLVHEGRWNLTLHPDRTVTWRRPDGTTWKRVTGTNRRPTDQARNLAGPHDSPPDPHSDLPPDLENLEDRQLIL